MGILYHVKGVFSTIELWSIVMMGQVLGYHEYLCMSCPRAK